MFEFRIVFYKVGNYIYSLLSGFLTIGVPSIKRANGPTYILQTIESLIENTSAEEHNISVVVVVFLADQDIDYNKDVSKMITKKHQAYINLGFLQIVTVGNSFYPPLVGLKHNFNDHVERVKWRSKQVSDYVFLFLLSHKMSKFYLQLEDDVISSPRFVHYIQQYIKIQQGKWTLLEFSELGFIGKLFKDSDLLKFSRFLWTFYDEQPVDWLVGYFRKIMSQDDIRLRKPTLFQHMGTVSSFDTSKANNLKDRFFVSAYQNKSEVNLNPPAEIITNLKPHNSHLPEYAYSSAESYFWAVNAEQDNYYEIIFYSFETVDSISVDTGIMDMERHRLNDILHHGELQVSRHLNEDEHTKLHSVRCKNYSTVGIFEGGHVDVNLSSDITNPFMPIRCVKIVITKSQQEWMILYKIVINKSSAKL